MRAMARVRSSTFLVIAAAVLTVIFLISSSSRQAVSAAAQAVTPHEVLDNLPKFSKFPALPALDIPARFHWYNSAHRPPIQKNSTNGESSWYSDWRWLNPFSSTVTLDEDRALLPPPLDRPFVYTYYDTKLERDKEIKKADTALLDTWRRAWWAQGFRPVILTQADAIENPLYRQLAPKGLPRALKNDFYRWLAWSYMGTGLLSDYRCFPMSAFDDPVLLLLRRGQYGQLVRFDLLESGLFAGEKVQIDAALKGLLTDVRLSTFKSVEDGIPVGTFRVEQGSAFAYYSTPTLAQHYSSISQSFAIDPVKATTQLIQLITSHLHTTWQNTFGTGVAVLKPLPAHTTALVEPSIHLAQLLVECSSSLYPTSCPPNRPHCTPCVSVKPRVYLSSSYTNNTSLFTIATVPHPLTLLALEKGSPVTNLTIDHIRRNTDRDSWLTSITQTLLGTGRGAPSRLVAFKDLVASSRTRSRTLFFTVEHFPADFHLKSAASKVPTNDVQKAPSAPTPFPEDWLELIDWHFGFSVPRHTDNHGESINPVPLPERWHHASNEPEEHRTSYDPPKSSAEQLGTEIAVLKEARVAVRSKNRQLAKVRDAAEKWNLADLEAWKFVRAFRAQESMERDLYEREEGRIVAGARNGRWW